MVVTHSSQTTSDKYGEWARECRNCHEPHYQKQKTYKNTDANNLYLATGTITNCVYNGNNTSTLTYSAITYKTGWDAAKLTEKTSGYRRAILWPNVGQTGYNYPIIAVDTPTANTIRVSGNACTYLYPPKTFAAMYGQFIRDFIDVGGVSTQVKFLDRTGAKSFSDGDTTYNGICEVCHTQTGHFRNNGSASDQNHANVGGAGGTNCISCHNHINGFAHGGGGGTGCDDCHGKDADNDGVGTTQSHSTHTENDADDARGPHLACNACHDTNRFPYFKSGTDSNGDGKYNLSETDVCDTCHSLGGTYDGINNPAYGAKTNWSAGVYSGNNLKFGKEKWCATCHDEVPSIIQGVSAPNVVGDEDGDYIYGTGWGYYKTGHGLPAGETFPSKGGIVTLSGRPVECDSCHDYSTTHIDGNARTFTDGGNSTLDPSYYRQGYRLKLVAAAQGTGTSTREPMLVPWPLNTANSANNYRLCVTCHASGPFVNADDTNTNLKTDGVNRHEYHLAMNTYKFSSDWDFANDNSRIICVNCHNVHGSTRLAMVRDGKLIDREPGLMIWYNNDDIVTYETNNPDPPSPENLPLSASTGTIWIGNSSSNLCSHCHGSPNTLPEYRTPFQSVAQAPTLSWTGETNYESDGVYPDSAASGSTFTFRVKYTDNNNDAPSPIELWIDTNDNGSYESGEKYAMTGADTGDLIYTDGKIYFKTLTVNSAGDNAISYRFYASDGTDTATGFPTNDSSITLFNNTPTLSWTGETYYENDGVNPNTGGAGSSFEFRINYTDADNQAPASIQVWVDENDDGSYEAGEKHNITPADGGDTTYSDGKLYTLTLLLAYAGDGSLNYRFFASDGSANATGSPTANNTVTVNVSANIPPSLEWVTGDCRTDGVKPVMGLATGDFEFKIKYTDINNQCPTSGSSDIQVWVDVNDTGDGNYEPGEKFNLLEEDAGDTDCTDGKLFKTTIQLAYAGDGNLNYRFYASDGVDSAVGLPATNRILTVVSTTDATGVRTSGGGHPWYSDIQTALDNTPQNKTVLVYPGTYGSIQLTNSGSGNQIDHGKTVKSVCGPDVTTISGGTQAVYSGVVDNVTVDGFQITGANIGVSINTSTVTINNCKIHSNTNSGGSGGGVYMTNVESTVTITNSEIYSNSADNGGGIFLSGGNNPVISNTVIRNNSTTSGSGGGVFLQNSVVATFNDVTIKDNTTAFYSGGVHINTATANFFRCFITGNVSSSLGGFMYMTNTSSVANFENCIVANNRGTQGGAVYANNVSAMNFVNSTIADNQATGGNGG
ncbi:MAG: right-handed parallel beta-helix repeat-containing protein, partial [Pseudomonadota bacterium]